MLIGSKAQNGEIVRSPRLRTLLSQKYSRNALTAITLMLAQGINPKAVSATVRHATVAFTLDRCGHVLPSMEDEAASRMDQLFKVAT
jgi:hypothetical protein